jgi:hypothetical protein
MWTGSDWSAADLGVVDWAILYEDSPWFVVASIILDGYPASWPRPLRKKERRR